MSYLNLNHDLSFSDLEHYIELHNQKKFINEFQAGGGYTITQFMKDKQENKHMVVMGVLSMCTLLYFLFYRKYIQNYIYTPGKQVGGFLSAYQISQYSFQLLIIFILVFAIFGFLSLKRV